jgi:hypothetical protein
MAYRFTLVLITFCCGLALHKYKYHVNTVSGNVLVNPITILDMVRPNVRSSSEHCNLTTDKIQTATLTSLFEWVRWRPDINSDLKNPLSTVTLNFHCASQNWGTHGQKFNSKCYKYIRRHVMYVLVCMCVFWCMYVPTYVNKGRTYLMQL